MVLPQISNTVCNESKSTRRSSINDTNPSFFKANDPVVLHTIITKKLVK
jgi:hypothetical protein